MRLPLPYHILMYNVSIMDNGNMCRVLVKKKKKKGSHLLINYVLYFDYFLHGDCVDEQKDFQITFSEPFFYLHLSNFYFHIFLSLMFFSFGGPKHGKRLSGAFLFPVCNPAIFFFIADFLHQCHSQKTSTEATEGVPKLLTGTL